MLGEKLTCRHEIAELYYSRNKILHKSSELAFAREAVREISFVDDDITD